MINQVDHFVFLDSVQFTSRDWRTRNQIKTPQGLNWLSVPISGKIQRNTKIDEVQIADSSFIEKHLESIRRNYSKGKYFESHWKSLCELLQQSYSISLSKLNQNLVKNISKGFAIDTKFHNSRDFSDSNDASQRLINICKDLDADIYLSGPRAMGYLNLKMFSDSGIDVQWVSYNFLEYSQLWGGEFVGNVSVVDLILNEGFNRKLLEPITYE